MLTRRGRSVFALGFGVYLAARAFGSKPLYPVATGLLLVVLVAWAWIRLANRPFAGTGRAARLSAARPARVAVLGVRLSVARRPTVAAAPAYRLRVARRARVRARRVAPARALAVDCTTRTVDGQGARRCTARR